MTMQNIVPRQHNSGESLGTEQKQWTNVYTKNFILDGKNIAGSMSSIDDAIKTNAKAIEDLGKDVAEDLKKKVNTDQGAENAGKYFAVDENGNVALVELKQGDGVAVGTIVSWPGTLDNIPEGLLPCNHQSMSASGIAQPLFDKIGYAFGGSGDTFYLPDYNLQTNDDCVVEYDGTSDKWWRLYKSGWLEQGGVLLPESSQYNKMITLPKPYASDNYHVSQNFEYDNTANATFNWVNATNKSTTSFYVWVSSAAKKTWFTCGQSAEIPAQPNKPIICIKAYNADVESVDPTTEQQLRNEIARQSGEIAKLDAVIDYDSSSDGTIWYRKYKSGWLEQGGKKALDNTTITLVKSYKNTSYNISLTMQASGNYESPVRVYSVSENSFTVAGYRDTLTSSLVINWKTEGWGE